MSSKEMITLTESQIELIRSIGTVVYNGEDIYYNIPFWFKHLGGNRFEIIRKDQLPQDIRELYEGTASTIKAD
jgi:hypothetical protein